MGAKFRVLVSVSDKTGLLDYGQKFVDRGCEIVSTGGTANALRGGGIPVTDASEVTRFPELMGGRLKTIHPRIIGGMIANRANLEHLGELAGQNIELFDALIVNLYPLEATIAEPNATREKIIESIDIGGPNMISAAAKGGIPVIIDPADMPELLSRLTEGTHLDPDYTARLAVKATTHVAGYRLAEARWRSGGDIDGMVGKKVLACKYGENAWQTPAGLYSTGSSDPLGLDKFQVVAGQPPSYNNLCDLDRMLQTATHIAVANELGDLAIAVKHGNPCGAAFIYHEGFPKDEDQEKLIVRTVDGDRRAVFGGLLLTSFCMSAGLAEILLTHGMPAGQRRVLDGIIAPGFSPDAIEMLKRKGDKCRFIRNDHLYNLKGCGLDSAARFRYVRGGFLRQPNYTAVPNWSALNIHPDDQMDIRLAWSVGAHSNSNTITLVKNGMLIGNGVGQQDRVGCCELALKRARDAGHDPRGAVAYSDSFFPFEDGPQVLIDAGIRAIFATSGSIRDAKVRAVCENAGVRLYQLPDAEARGFFGH